MCFGGWAIRNSSPLSIGRGIAARRSHLPSSHRTPHALRAVSTTSKQVTSTEDATDVWDVVKVRSTFLDFFATKYGHAEVTSSPVVPLNDPTLLFTNAGMNQFKPIFLGTVSPESPLSKLERACNSQKCIRAGGKHNDLEDVGLDTYHHTFFEMLGTWSFGDYFKIEAIDMAWELLTEVYGLDSERLYATYFGGDEAQGLEPDLEAKEAWLRYLPEERVLAGSSKDNFWEMGESGPCGPCSELHYDALGGRGNVRDLVNADDPEVLEIWNIVFIQFNRDPQTNELSSLPAKHIDTGMGLERLTAILQRKLSNYDTDAFSSLFKAIHLEAAAGVGPYGGSLASAGDDTAEARRDTAYRAVADHVRCLCFALADGARPSNEGRGYVLRRVLRRAVRYGRQVLGASDGFLSRLAPAFAASHFGDVYPELRDSLKDVVAIIKDEEDAFAKTLERGVKYLDEELAKVDQRSGVLSGSAAFFLYDSLGFPIDLTALMAAEQGFRVDEEGFALEMRDQVERSRAARQAKRAEKLGVPTIALGATEIADLGADNGVLPTTSLIHDDPACPVQATVVALFKLDDQNRPIRCEEVAAPDGILGVVLDKSPFYPEGGGQVADVGIFETIEGEELQVVDVQSYAGFVLHTCRPGELGVGDVVSARVDSERRKRISPNHSMTHALNHALRATLGDGVDQRGSVCDEDRLRFDFSHPKAVEPAQLTEIEHLVNALVESRKPVQAYTVPLKRALAVSSLRAVFGENYPDPVRVVVLGSDVDIAEILDQPTDPRWFDISIELCGGTHVADTSEAEAFVVVDETAVAKGIRRIEAVTRDRAIEVKRTGRRFETIMGELEQGFTDENNEDGAIAEKAKALRADMDASVLPATLKPKLRMRLDSLTKALAAKQKQRRAELVAEATRALSNAAAAAADGEDRLVLEIGPGIDAKSVASMTSKVHAEYANLAILAVSRQDDAERALVFAAVPPNHPLNGQAPALLEAVLKPLGGKGGGKSNFAQGSVSANSLDNLDLAFEAARAFQPP